mmetsp:Transcript_5082/g.6009  ORF Transcript_5082/g.6009 Transcript_5082/m.6009 type:complete len:82 (-) Transcript_5082:18-263(-)
MKLRNQTKNEAILTSPQPEKPKVRSICRSKHKSARYKNSLIDEDELAFTIRIKRRMKRYMKTIKKLEDPSLDFDRNHYYSD